MFVFAQIFGILAWIALLISYYQKNTDKILIYHILSIAFYLLNYLFLGAWSGLFIMFLELIRDILYYKTDKDNIVFLTTLPIYLILFIFSIGNVIELIPIIASLFEGFTLTKKKNIVVPGALMVYSMWIIYDIKVGAYTIALTNVLIVFSNIGILINLIRNYKIVDNFKITSRYSLKREDFKKLNELKKDIYAKEMLLSDSYESKLYKENKKNLVFIKNNNDLKGYFTTIQISKKTLNKITELNEINIEYENLILNMNLIEGKILLIDTIAIKEKYQNKKSIELIKKHLLKYVNSKKFSNIVIIASTEFEKNIAQQLSLINSKTLNDKSILYSKKVL